MVRHEREAEQALLKLLKDENALLLERVKEYEEMIVQYRSANEDRAHREGIHLMEIDRLQARVKELETLVTFQNDAEFLLLGDNADLRAALERIAAPTYGTELCNSDEENNAILAPLVFLYQEIARDALNGASDEGGK